MVNRDQLTYEQQAARERAVKVLTHYISLLLDRTAESRGGRTPADEQDTRVEVEGIVDDIILASQLPLMTAHEAAVASIRREAAQASSAKVPTRTRTDEELKRIADNPDIRD